MVAVQESLQGVEGIRMWEIVIACMVKTMKWVVSRQVILFLGFLLVVVMLFVASLLAEDHMQEKQQAVVAGTTIAPESISPETDQAVGRAIEKYEAVLDAQWTDRDCTLSSCPHSSRAIPGVPTGRGLFTTHERNNIEERGNLLAYPSSSRVQVRSDIELYSVKAKNNDELEAIVYVTIIKTSEDNEKNSNSSDIHIMTLAPSSLNNGEYVVMEDIIDGSNMQVPHIQPLYTNG